MDDQERRRRAGIAAITAKYLRYIEEYKSDEGFSTEGMGTLQQLRQATLDAHLIVIAATGLELTQQGKRALADAASAGF